MRPQRARRWAWPLHGPARQRGRNERIIGRVEAAIDSDAGDKADALSASRPSRSLPSWRILSSRLRPAFGSHRYRVSRAPPLAWLPHEDARHSPAGRRYEQVSEMTGKAAVIST